MKHKPSVWPGRFMKRTLLRAFFGLAFLAIGTSFSLAQSSSPSDDFQSAVTDIGNEYGASVQSACRGPTVNGLASGLPDNPTDDVRCQAISALGSACLNLANEAGSIQEAVINGTASYDDAESQAESKVGSDAITASQAVYLAQQAGPAVSPGTLTRNIYSSCTSLITK